MNRDPDEYELALRARQGDRDALAALVERTRLRLFSLAYAELRHYDDAQDAVAGALLQICLHVTALKKPEKIRAWMQRIVRNEARRLRRGAGSAVVSLEECDDPSEDALPSLLRLDIERALRGLPLHEAQALRLFYLDDLSLAEVARRVGRPVGTIGSWLHRGRQHLASRMEDYAPVAIPRLETESAADVTVVKGGTIMAWQQFTERARDAVMFAHAEAKRRGDALVGTENLLFGLLIGSNPDSLLERGVAAGLLARLGISLLTIRREIEHQGVRRPGDAGPEPILTEDARRAIDLAYEESLRLQHDYIGTEHLLLGILREENGIGGQILRQLGVDPDRILQELPEVSAKLGAIHEASRRLADAKDAYFAFLAGV